MDDIIERLTKASGPDREIDGLIWSEMDNRDVRWGETHFGKHSMLAKSRTPPHDECVVGALSEGRFMTVGQNPSLPQYTGSIDVALTLVPDAYDATVNTFCWVELTKKTMKAPGPRVDHTGHRLRFRHARQPILALCIAGLTARAALR